MTRKIQTNGAEIRLLDVIRELPQTIVVFYQKTSMNRTECYDRLSEMIRKGLVRKKIIGERPNNITIYCITDDGVSVLEEWEKEKGIMG